MIRVVFTGGGSGGHLLSLVAIFRELKALVESEQKDLEGYLFSDIKYVPQGKNRGVLPEEIGLRHVRVFSGKLRRYLTARNFLDPFLTLLGFWQSLWLLWKIMPDVIVSKGGSAALPVSIAGWLYRIPLVIHESDSQPGMVSKISAFMAARVGISFVDSAKFFPQKKTALVGHPIRTSLRNGSAARGAKRFSLDPSRHTILVMGGSQGAQEINKLVLYGSHDLLNIINIIHICGAKNFSWMEQETKKFPASYRLYSFLGEEALSDAYKMCSVIVSRAGSGSIFEIAFVGKPSILIPLASAAGDHQRKNAYIYARYGACEVIESENATPEVLADRVRTLLLDEDRMKTMSKAASGFAKPDAARKMAEAAWDVIKDKN